MPTIDELEAVVVASDDDALPVSQSGSARRVSRSQLLAGTQAAIALTSGLLGRVSSGLGPPEQVAIGNGLSLSNGVLSASPPFSATALQHSPTVGLGDVIPIGQGGQDRSVTVRALLSVGGADVSSQVARNGVGSARRLSEWFSDAIAIEAFGALGDGVTDDSGAFGLAVASGRPILLGSKVYRIDGQWNVQTSTVILGTPGISVLRRFIQRGGAWINVSAPSFTSIGVIFDAGGIVGDGWGVLLAPTCIHSIFRQCRFSNTTGPTLGSGLTIQARDGLIGHQSSHTISDCVFQNNACHGLWIQAACGAEVRSCRAFSNGGFGINLDFNDPLFQQIVRQSTVSDCKCWNNTRGISIGNYNSTNQEPPRWGLENPDATDILVTGNVCSANSAYGIAVSGSRIQVTSNLISVEDTSDTASGILCNASLTSISCNVIVGPGQFGIDAGGCADLAITCNTIENCAVGINAGGSTTVRLSANELKRNKRAITVFQVETDGHGSNFGIACSNICIEDNRIQLEAGDGGIFLIDGPENIEISRNRFISPVASTLTNSCWAHTDSAVITQNSWNNSSQAEVGAQLNGALLQLIVPEIFDSAIVDPLTTRIDVIRRQHQADMIGQISFVRVTFGGTGYTHASIAFGGSGAGATASAYIRDGIIIGFAMTASGGGYSSSSIFATVTGDGQGATALPIVGVPLGKSRRLTLRCGSSVCFPQKDYQTNWTNRDLTVPAGGQIVWEGDADSWRAAWFNSIDYVQPNGDGSVAIKSAAGDIKLRPAPGGGVRFCSDQEPAGFLTLFGRGSPEGSIIAPPGSDYRNLNGGPGLTLWLKQTGIGSAGWSAIA